MSNRGRCPAGVDNMGTVRFMRDGSKLGYDYDRCRRFEAHAGPHVLDCGGAFDREGCYINGPFVIRSRAFTDWVAFVDYLVEHNQLYV